MQNHFGHLFLLLRRLCLSLLLLWFCRILFYLFNLSYFSDLGFGELLFLLVAGLRFDLSAAMMVNTPFIFLSLLPFPFRTKEFYQKILKWVFLLSNGFALALSSVDFIYFRFTFKRSTSDLFSFVATGDDTTRLIPQFIKDYWFVLLLFIALTWLVTRLYKKVDKKIVAEAYHTKDYFVQTLVLFVSSALVILFMRGGFQMRPISIINGSEYTSAKNIPLVINTPFSIITSSFLEEINEMKYMSDAEANKIVNPIHPADTGTFKPMNVMVIMLESFSKEYIGSLSGKKTCTPFFDSLINQSLVFDNAYSNGKKSIEGIPEVVAGLPTLMNESYINSRYNGNEISTIASLLKVKGYNSTFYHGATNGSMNFDVFSHIAGFDNYFGRTEYGTDKDYDGAWGVWDEEFFQKVADEMNKQKQPFVSALFTLTSHHPFPVPEKYKQKFPDDGLLPIHKSISYSDYSLKNFFDKAKQMPWYNNTLFVLTADHTGQAGEPFYDNRVGMYQIPIVFFCPSDSTLKGRNHTLMQHIDILPSILDYLNYDKPFFCFGNSVFNQNTEHYAVNFLSNIYGIISDDCNVQFDGEKFIAHYDYKNDSLLKHNLPGTDHLSYTINDNAIDFTDKEKILKAFIQQYNKALIKNEMK